MAVFGGFRRVAVAVAVFWPTWRHPLATVAGSEEASDAIEMFYPFRAFANAEWLAGRVPLWNPFQFCGYPFHAEE